MKKRSMKNYLKYGILLLVIPLLLLNCEKDEVVENTSLVLKTVSINEAKEVFKKKGLSKDKITPYVNADLNSIIQEDLINSDEKLIVIKANTIYENHYSRILMLKVNNEIQTIVFSMYASKFEKDENFTGELIITDIEGNFINGYRVKNGELKTQFIKREGTYANRGTGESCPDHGPCVEGSYCNSCEQILNEVIITGSTSSDKEVVSIITTAEDPKLGGGGINWDEEILWDYSVGTNDTDCTGGKVYNDTTKKCECPDDKVEDSSGNCIPVSLNCTKRSGLLHDANFTNRTPILGNNITDSSDNFRNDSWSIIKETNCGNGTIPGGSTVNVTSTTPVVRTLANGTKLNYYRVEYDDCPDVNNPESPNFDSSKPCTDCFKANMLNNMTILPTPGDIKHRNSKPENGDFGGRSGNHKGIDLKAPVGTPIYAQFDGEIIGPIVNSWPDDTGGLSFVKFRKNRKKNGLDVNAGGNRFYVKSTINGTTYKIGYFHIKKDGLLHTSGTKIKKGDLLGYTGETGTAMAPGSGGPHLHNEFWKNQSINNKVDPKDFYFSNFNDLGETTNPCN